MPFPSIHSKKKKKKTTPTGRKLTKQWAGNIYIQTFCCIFQINYSEGYILLLLSDETQ